MNCKRRRLVDQANLSVDNSQIKSHSWDRLPDSVCLKVFSYLNVYDLVFHISNVNRKFRRLVYDRYLWKDLCLLNSKLENNGKAQSQILIRHLFEVSQFVRNIDFRYCGPISTTILSTLPSHCLQRLQSLCLEGCIYVNDEGIRRIAKACSGLRDINLLFTSVTEESLIDLFKNNRNIESLVCHSSCLSIKALSVLASHCQGLQILHASDGQPPSPQFLQDNNRATSILTNDMLFYITKLSQLRILIMKYETVSIHDACFSLLGKYCQLLECIDISYIGPNSNLTDNGVSTCCMFLPRLQYLHLYEHVKVTNLTLDAIGSYCPDLRSLSFEDAFFDDDGITNLVLKCSYLESLSIGVSDSSSKDLTDKSVYAIAKHCGSRLFNLHMLGWDLSNSGLLMLSKELKNIKHLSVESCLLLTTEGLSQALRCMNNLISLDISFTDLLDRGLKEKLFFPPTLKRLRVCGLGLSDNDIISLRRQCNDLDVREY